MAQQEVLTSFQMYRSEISQFPRLTQEQEQDLIAQARNGDEQARTAIIESCLGYVAFVSACYKRHAPRDTYLDLVGVGNLTLVEVVDKALTLANPYGYLFRAVRIAIIHYCFPDVPSPDVESLDAPIFKDSKKTGAETLVAQECGTAPDQQAYVQLYEALDTLPQPYQEVITRHYGLRGRPAETLYQISREITAYPGPKSSKAYHIEYRALNRLRQQLEEESLAS